VGTTVDPHRSVEGHGVDAHRHNHLGREYTHLDRDRKGLEEEAIIAGDRNELLPSNAYLDLTLFAKPDKPQGNLLEIGMKTLKGAPRRLGGAGLHEVAGWSGVGLPEITVQRTEFVSAREDRGEG
jgi:hypothetical protein